MEKHVSLGVRSAEAARSHCKKAELSYEQKLLKSQGAAGAACD